MGEIQELKLILREETSPFFSDEEIAVLNSMLVRIAENLSGGEINEEEVLEYIKNEDKGDGEDA